MACLLIIIPSGPFLDISDRTHQPLYPADEMGMLGFTFHPQFNENKYFYVNYVDKDDFTIISRFTVHNKLGNVDSEQILIKLKQPFMNHNGGCIEFGLDGYWSTWGTFAPDLIENGKAATMDQINNWYKNGITTDELDSKKIYNHFSFAS